ncbi:nitroreductase family protein [Streptococcus sciuri]|uniref:Nitroreductase family protein n=1 Tax=Streptococcus sciuri TaxID=2973939 RepID=A0ABT2F7G8_9STRE|nr:nitroreductase family protein [Streptococcus sciuri]MCS4488440.1 nitroreductase family protein [Streptococcus sciuri]
MSFVEDLKKRRSHYALSRKVDVTDDTLVEVIKEVVRYSPSAFNSQSSRAVILLNDQVSTFWNDLVANTLESVMKAKGASEEALAATKAKLNSFSKSKGTILLFEDQDVIKNLQEQFPPYAENFPDWSEQSTGIVSVNIWTTLSAEFGLGANLQHYNPVIDDQVAKRYAVPTSWKLRGQLNFGNIEAEPHPKDFIKDDNRFKVFA